MVVVMVYWFSVFNFQGLGDGRASTDATTGEGKGRHGNRGEWVTMAACHEARPALGRVVRPGGLGMGEGFRAVGSGGRRTGLQACGLLCRCDRQ